MCHTMSVVMTSSFVSVVWWFFLHLMVRWSEQVVHDLLVQDIQVSGHVVAYNRDLRVSGSPASRRVRIGLFGRRGRRGQSG